MDHARRARVRAQRAFAAVLTAALTFGMLPQAAFADTSGFEGGGSL